MDHAKDFYSTTENQKLYHGYMQRQCHCRLPLPPSITQEIWDHEFENNTPGISVRPGGDHYKWHSVRWRSNGIINYIYIY